MRMQVTMSADDIESAIREYLVKQGIDQEPTSIEFEVKRKPKGLFAEIQFGGEKVESLSTSDEDDDDSDDSEEESSGTALFG